MGRGKRRSDTLTIVEAAYQQTRSEREWLEAIVSAAEPEIGAGLGTAAYVYNAAGAPLELGTWVSRGENFPDELLQAAVRGADEAYIALTWRRLSFAFAASAMPFEDIPSARVLVDLGIRDMLAINAYDPSGIGVWLGAPLPDRRHAHAADTARWTRVAAHLAAAFRLRRRGGSDRPAAVISTTGKIDHAEGDASSAEYRDRLRDAVVAMERARGRLRAHDPAEALDTWRTLVDARFTLLDHFETSGKRYIIAVENSPIAKGPEVLTVRERQVVAAAAAGRSNKLIAYELGLSASTVRVLIARAASKLDVSTRRELLAVFAAHARTATS